MDGACNTNGRLEKFMQHFSRKTGKGTRETLGLNKRRLDFRMFSVRAWT